MTSELTNQLATELLLSGLMSVLAVGILSVVVTVLCVRAHRQRKGQKGLQNPTCPTPAAYRPSAFEQSCRWCVVKSRQVASVQRVLGLHNAIPCSWGEGTSRLTSGKLFVSPPIRGWILVMGQGLPDPSEDVDRCFHLVCRLSRALGQVQFFSANRAANHHAWVWAQGGRIRRAYAWAGETVWNQGGLTPAEKELELKCFGYGEHPELADLSGAGQSGLNSDKVTALAARWSFDPTSINENMLHVGLGVAGVLTQLRRH